MKIGDNVYFYYVLRKKPPLFFRVLFSEVLQGEIIEMNNEPSDIDFECKIKVKNRIYNKVAYEDIYINYDNAIKALKEDNEWIINDAKNNHKRYMKEVFNKLINKIQLQ